MVRIYCLTCISKIPPRNIETTPYENNADETTFIFGVSNDTPKMIQLFFENAKYYQLTEICIGFEKIGNMKRYVMFIFREDTKLYVIPMHRGAVTFTKFSNNVHELYVATSKLFSWKIDFDLLFKIRSIKNTIHKAFMTKEEKELYDNYSKRMKFAICLVDDDHLTNEEFHDFQEKIFDEHPLEIPDTTRPNALRTKLSLFNRIIDALCHPQNGSYKNVPPTQEFNQKAVCLLKKQNTWWANKPRKGVIETNTKNYHESDHIIWDDVDISKLKLEDFKPKNLKNLNLKETRIYDSEDNLLPFFEQLDLTNLQQLELRSCKITKLFGNFFTKFSPFLSTLILKNNDIIYVSPLISELYGLEDLDLSGNKNLSDKGFFFEDLPPFISSLILEETSITKIPKEIERLEFLNTLSVNSKELKFVAWENISSQIERLYVIGGDGEINEVNLSDKNNLEWFELCHTTLKNLKCTNLPSSLTDLNLSNNKLTHFDMENNLPLIEELHLNNNNLIQIVWETLSPKLQYIGFDNNQIQSIGNISYLIYLEEMSANFNQIRSLSFGNFDEFEWLNEISLSNNLLSALPEGFENLKGLRILDLSKNEFNYFDTTNLEDILWKRLPRELKTLNLSGNNLHQLPCFLKDFNIENLIVVDCKISHICPYIYAKSIETDLPRHFDISKNPLIALPFIPQTIIEPPLTKRNFVVTKLNQNFKITSENAEFLSPFLLNFLQECDESNHQFPTFEGEKVPINCYCCGKCGSQTEENPVEQIMIMDYLIEISNALTKTKAPKKNSNKKRSKPNQKKNVPAHESDKNVVASSEAEVENTDVIQDSDTAAPPQLQQYSPGNWKTKVITKLCKSCIKSIQTKAKDVLKLYEDKYLLSQKSKKQFKSMKNFFAATIDAIEGMDKLKNSLQLSAENKSDIKNATRTFELSEFLHPNISKIVDLRQALPWLYQYYKDEAALSELLASFDSESKKLIEFSYEISEICFCQQQQLRNVIKYDSCFTLEITAPEEYNGTFDALLSNWSAHYSQELCGECNNYIYIKNNLKIGAEQNYLIVEINASEKMSGSIFHNNFTSYFIFGALWSLVGAIELQNCSEPRNYITWQRYENGKWKCIKNGRHWFKDDFPQNLKSFPILIFEKLSTIFIPPNNSMPTNMPFESNMDNSVMNYAQSGLDISPAHHDQHLQQTFYPQNIPELHVFHTGPAELSSTQLYPEVEQHPSTSSQFYQYYSAPIYQNEQQQYFEQTQQMNVVDPNTLQQPSESANDQQSLPPIHAVIQGKTFQNL